MNFYSSLGFLVFGSRLRRMSEYFLMEVNKVYEQANIPFDASWFPVFYLLSHQQPMPLIDIAEQLEVSHSAISQMISSLKKKGLVETSPCLEDGRRQMASFTPEGTALLQRLQPVWKAITKAMTDLARENEQSQLLLEAISGVESSMQATPLSARIAQVMRTHQQEKQLPNEETI